MNPIKKAWCRIYQTAFYLAMPLLPYREPQVFESVKDLTPVLKKLKIKSVLLVTDETLRKTGLIQPIENDLRENEIGCTIYDKTCQNPTVHNAQDARDLYFKDRCDCIIAFGGGSPMDCAKAAGALIAHPKKSLAQIKGNLHVLRKTPTLIAIPTTAGTGSEVTLTAVITDPEKQYKYTINDFSLIPSYAVLDPALTYTLPPSLTATTGMDALTHAVEAYIGRSTSKETRKMALSATKLIFENIETACKNGSDGKARSNMLYAAYLAGAAFSRSYVGYIHAVAHSLGGQYNIPHGLANSVLMPIVLEGYGSTAEKKLHDLAVAAGVAEKNETDSVAAKKFISAIRRLNKILGIPEKLSGINHEDILQMAARADKEANPLYPVPLLMDARELKKFYYAVSDRSKEQ